MMIVFCKFFDFKGVGVGDVYGERLGRVSRSLSCGGFFLCLVLFSLFERFLVGIIVVGGVLWLGVFGNGNSLL